MLKDKQIIGYMKSGLPIYVISGGAEPEPDDPKPDPKPDDPKPSDPKPDDDKRFTQADLDKAAAAARREGKRSAAEDLAKELGISVEDAKKVIADAKKAEDEKKDEATKAREAADAEKAAAEREKTEAAKERHAVKVERALLKAGIDPDKTERVAKLVEVEVGAEADEIETAVETLKSDIPTLFAETDEETEDDKPTGSDPKGKQPKPKGGDDAIERGRKRAEQHVKSDEYSFLKTPA